MSDMTYRKIGDQVIVQGTVDIEPCLCIFCNQEPAVEKYWPYCSAQCAIGAETDGFTYGITLRTGQLAPSWAKDRRACHPKIQHETEELAITHAKALVSRGVHRSLKIRAYQCDHCGYWHVGHPGGV